MPDKTNDTVIATVMEQLMAEGPQAMAQIITALMNLAMRMEREQFLGAGHYERAVDRRGYANGTKPKLIDTLAGTLSLEVPKTAGTDEPYLPAGAGAWPTLVPRGHAGGRRDVCVRRLDPRCRAGDGRVRLEEPVIDPGQPGRQAAR
jgi:hypothetical protein